MVTYDGRVACNIGLGAQHCVGYLDQAGFDIKKL